MRVGIFGAGAIGASIGVRLSAAGIPVSMVARPSLIQVADGLVSHGLDGRAYVPGDDLLVDEDPDILADVDVCLITVKSRHTLEAAQTLHDILPTRACVLSLQNGLRNPRRLREHLQHPVAGGMVSYNVVRPQPAVFRQATRGPIIVGDLPERSGDHLRTLRDRLSSVDIDLKIRDDIDDVMAGKLLLNLNNGVCALTGVTVAQSIRSRQLRWCLSQLMREGLTVLRSAGLRPRSIVGLPPGAIARLLTLPDAIVLRVAKSLVAVDPSAKSSTLQDIEAGKPTEIDDLCGEIVERADEVGIDAPANTLVTHGVHELEGRQPPPFWTPKQLQERLRAALVD